jgi:hypothetical protein
MTNSAAVAIGQDYLLTYIFTQSPTRYENTYSRTSFVILLANLGSILYTVRSISNGMVTGWSVFDISSSMMRKLYTSKKHGNLNQP